MVTIKSLHVEGLNGRLNYDLQFNERLNILTGRNGSGKTSILKLLWYVVSNQFEALQDRFYGTKMRIVYGDNSVIEFGVNGDWLVDSPKSHVVPTYFFPTFRLVEGGFPIDSEESLVNKTLPKNYWDYFAPKMIINLDNDVLHHFILQLSSNHISQFLLKKFAEINNLIHEKYDALDTKLESEWQSVKGNESEELKLYKENYENKKKIEAQMMQPFTTLNNLITKFYQDKGIQITEGIVLGSKDYVELAENLSSGEKQMLTFLAYSLFTKDSIIFIDEPEISLHPDWQTDLIPTLMSQNNGNQYFIATHSPFIYADYLEYDINLDTVNEVEEA